MEKSLIDLNIDYWYKFMAISGLLIFMFTEHTSFGLSFLFYGLGVWSTQNRFIVYSDLVNWHDDGRDILFSVVARVIGISIAVLGIMKFLNINF